MLQARSKQGHARRLPYGRLVRGLLVPFLMGGHGVKDHVEGPVGPDDTLEHWEPRNRSAVIRDHAVSAE